MDARPIREALIQLRNQELIKTIPQSGTYISKIDIRSADLARYMRKKLEQPILQECSAKMNDTAHQRLEMILEQTDQAILAQDKKPSFFWIKPFHQMLQSRGERRNMDLA